MYKRQVLECTFRPSDEFQLLGVNMVEGPSADAQPDIGVTGVQTCALPISAVNFYVGTDIEAICYDKLKSTRRYLIQARSLADVYKRQQIRNIYCLILPSKYNPVVYNKQY